MSADDVKRSTLLQQLFGAPLAAFEARGAFDGHVLHADEAQFVARAVPKRVREFAAGRACARAALAELQIDNYLLRVGEDREPVWPDGVTGSITHTRGYCGVVACRHNVFRALGIDAEAVDALRPELWRAIATPEEHARLKLLPVAQAALEASVTFSAKEAFFKCQFQITRQWLNFSDVQVSIGAHTFEITPRRTLQFESIAAAPWRGRYVLEDALVITGIGVPA